MEIIYNPTLYIYIYKGLICVYSLEIEFKFELH